MVCDANIERSLRIIDIVLLQIHPYTPRLSPVESDFRGAYPRHFRATLSLSPYVDGKQMEADAVEA